MKILRPQGDPAAFFRILREAEEHILLLDYDGTLSPFRSRRDEARPYPGVSQALDAVVREGSTRLVVVSGRPSEEVAGLLEMRIPPEIWGAHGWERRHSDGRVAREDVSEEARARLQAAFSWAQREGLEARIESKTGSCALHWRGLDQAAAEEIKERVEGAWKPLVEGHEMYLLPFDGGLEIRAGGRDKGTVVNEVLSGAGRSYAAAYLGDDFTDEDAFRALGERGLAVLVRPESRETTAALWIRPPVELLWFLGEWNRNASRI